MINNGVFSAHQQQTGEEHDQAPQHILKHKLLLAAICKLRLMIRELNPQTHRHAKHAERAEGSSDEAIERISA